LRDNRFVDGTYNTSFVEKLNSYSSEDGELAAAILATMSQRTRIKKVYVKQELKKGDDPWNVSRFDWADPYDSNLASSTFRWKS
jgi:hypothetical protein